MAPNSTFLQSLLSLDFDIDRVGLYLTNCIKLLTQAAWGHLGLHYAKKTSGKEPKLADPYGGCPSASSSLKMYILHSRAECMLMSRYRTDRKVITKA